MVSWDGCSRKTVLENGALSSIDFRLFAILDIDYVTVTLCHLTTLRILINRWKSIDSGKGFIIVNMCVSTHARTPPPHHMPHNGRRLHTCMPSVVARERLSDASTSCWRSPLVLSDRIRIAEK